MSKFLDITGQRFGRLTAIKFAERINNKTFWQVVCDCGNVKKVALEHLRAGHTLSCGCYAKEMEESE